ncbi:MAG: copper resistance protein NlpE N-terminal domain-containing protein [Woeseiaceae bacterium]
MNRVLVLRAECLLVEINFVLVAPQSRRHSGISVTFLNRLILLLVTLLIVSCGDDREIEPSVVLPDATLPGVYSGVFPCEGCPGIATTVWLRADKRFFFRQQYPADSTREAVDAYSLGRWSTIGEDRAIELAGSGPTRTFMRSDRDTLVMRTDSELEYRLVRDPVSSRFSAIIRMAGIMRMHGRTATFTECWTDFALPVSRGGDYARFRHQYRSAGGRSKPVYVELDGRISWSDDGTPKSLTIERFMTVRGNKTC